MGKKVTLFDDLDPELEADETITFALGANTYELDLSSKNIDRLRTALEPFIEAARKVPRIAPTVASVPRKKSAPNAELDAIRYWASKNGYAVSDKGRIPVHIVQAYHAANGRDVPVFAEAKG
jgi:hypothetical protein